MKSIIRIIIGYPVVFVLPLVSITCLILLSPLLAISLFLRQREPRGSAVTIKKMGRTDAVIFNRIDDVSKLTGCNTRSIQYRWTIFSDRVAELIKSGRRAALDFGAGSLRDTWELTEAGFSVLALDVNSDQLHRSKEAYVWNSAANVSFSSQRLNEIDPAQTFDLVIAFDVLEHLTKLDVIVPQLRDRLKSDGYLFVSVPNGRTFREKLARLLHILRVALGKLDESGIPHVNFKTPKGWTEYFESKGFCVSRHEMAIGSLANDWHCLHQFPLGVSGLAKRFPNLERVFCPEFLMRRFDLLDQHLKPITYGLWGWNLFVLTPAPPRT
jgi:SAM-dependent methyltransferase